MPDEVKKPLTAFEKFVHAIANVPKKELREADHRDLAEKRRKDSAENGR